MTHTINLVRKFHKAFGHPVSPRITPSTLEQRELRVKLIAEELGELCEALGVSLHLHYDVFDTGNVLCEVEAVTHIDTADLAAAADALSDIDYVTQGANLVFGFPAEAVTQEVHRANMSKLGEDGQPIYRDDGKIMKGPNYTPPDIAAVLKAHEQAELFASRYRRGTKSS